MGTSGHARSIRQAFLSRIVTVILLMTVLMGILVAMNEWGNQKRLLVSRGEQLTRYIATLSLDPFIMNDVLTLDAIVAEGKTDQEIIYVVIRDAEGRAVTTRHASLNYSAPVVSENLGLIGTIADLDELLSWLGSREGTLVVSPIVTGDHRIGSVEVLLSQQTIRRNILRTIAAIIVGNLGVVLFLSFVLMVVFRRVVFDPLSRLVDAVERMKSGERKVRIAEERPDEFGVLMRRFDEMVEEIERTTVSKSHYENVLQSTREGIVIVSRDGAVVDLNPAASDLLGASRERVAGMPLASLLPGGVSETFFSRQEGDVSRREVKIVNLAGEEIDLLVFSSPVRDSPDEARVLALVDVSELKKALRMIESINETLRREILQRSIAEEEARALNEDLIRQREELIQANESLESFCYTVSHDLRAPLRHINSFTSIIEEEYADVIGEEGRNLLQKVIKASARMGVMIDDLLAFSRVARAELHRVDLDLSAMAAEIVSMLHDTDPERNVQVSIEEGVHVHADPSLMRLVMENLLGNAWKYTSTREHAVIEFSRLHGERKEQIFFVRDNGIGFDMSYADRLFRVFERLHGAEYEGSGIGLASVRKIIERHGGRIWGEGVPGEGASFYFTLPR